MGICKRSHTHTHTTHRVIGPIANTPTGMDINPYRFEAPWHAFEFAFHIIEARANLVIISMAWLTREDSKSFTRMPNEPDMETLTYWAQRLEPVIRDESRDEVIVIFCNRTGIEEHAVYAGTSAVIGVKEGEVNVYGLLGRGVKELLVVDTDDPPYAKLVQREEAAHSHARAYQPKQPNSKHSSNHSSESRPSSTKSSNEAKRSLRGQHKNKERTSTKTNRSREHSSRPEMAEKTRARRPSVRISIPETYHRNNHSSKTSAPVSPSIPTPTAPSPTPESTRPQLKVPGSRPAKDHIDTPYPMEDYYKGRIIGGSVTVSTGEDLEGVETGPEKYFWMPSSSLLESAPEPPRRALPEIPLPPASPVVSGSLLKFPGRSTRGPGSSSSRRDASPKSEKSSSVSGRSEKSGRAGRSRDQDRTVPTRPATTTGVAPVRPSSPKSRNASRSGRHERRGSEAVDHHEITAMIERLEALRRRTQSAMSHRQEHSSTPTHDRPRSPKSRNASRSGRPLEIDQAMIERALNLSRGSIPIGASDSVLAATIQRPQSDILSKDQKVAPGGNVRPASRNHQHSMSDPDQPSSRAGAIVNRIGSPAPHIEPEESRTMLWSEISKIVGEHVGRPESREAPRGRQRSNSASSTQARPGSRGVPNAVRDAPSQTRQPNGTPIRSVRYPSQGPPADPDDEIVAEIIFHRPGNNPAQTSRSNSTEAVVGDVSAGRNSRQSQGSSLGTAKNETSPVGSQEAKHTSASSATGTKARPGDVKSPSPPNLSGASIYTLNSTKNSPTTPSPQAFEPSTPKAMVFDPEYASLLSTASDPLSDLKTQHFQALAEDKTTVPISRPRSAMM